VKNFFSCVQTCGQKSRFSGFAKALTEVPVPNKQKRLSHMLLCTLCFYDGTECIVSLGRCTATCETKH